MKEKKIVILGGTGYIGKPLLSKIIDENYKVKILIHKTNVKYNIEKFYGNILSSNILEREFSHFDVVVNITGQSQINKKRFLTENLIGGYNVLNSCVKNKIKNIILISTINVYGESGKNSSTENSNLCPESYYGQIKNLTEKLYQYYSETYRLNITILRLSNVYGINKKNGLIRNLITSHKNSKLVNIYHNGKQFRDFIFLTDVVSGIFQAVKYQKKGYVIINISSGKKYQIKNIVNLIKEISKNTSKVNYSSKKIGEFCIWANNTKAKKLLKFEPKTSIEEGIKISLQHI